jgi:hypothetical protein
MTRVSESSSHAPAQPHRGGCVNVTANATHAETEQLQAPLACVDGDDDAAAAAADTTTTMKTGKMRVTHRTTTHLRHDSNAFLLAPLILGRPTFVAQVQVPACGWW